MKHEADMIEKQKDLATEFKTFARIWVCFDKKNWSKYLHTKKKLHTMQSKYFCTWWKLFFINW